MQNLLELGSDGRVGDQLGEVVGKWQVAVQSVQRFPNAVHEPKVEALNMDKNNCLFL